MSVLSRKCRITGWFVLFLLLAATGYSQEWHSNGPYGADVTTIEVAAWDSSKVIIGTRFDGLYIRDMETGTDWQRFAPGLPRWAETIPRAPEDDYSQDVTVWGGDYPPIKSSMTAPGNNGVVFVGMGNRAYHSTDGGEHFDVVFEGGVEEVDIIQVWMLPGELDVFLIVGTDAEGINNLYFSDTNGFEWIKKPYPGVRGLVADPFDPTHLLMYGQIEDLPNGTHGIYQSFDTGYSWDVVYENMDDVTLLEANPFEEGMFVGYGELNNSPSFFLTRDSFSESYGGTNLTGEVTLAEFTGSRNVLTHIAQTDQLLMVQIPEEGNSVTWEFFEFNTSSDGLAFRNDSIVELLNCSLDPDQLLVATDTGVLSSTLDGADASWLDLGLNNARIDQIAASSLEPHTWFAWGAGGAWMTTDDGNEWTRLLARPTYGFAQNPSSGNVIFATDGYVFTGESPFSDLISHGIVAGPPIKLAYTSADTVWSVEAFGGGGGAVRYSTDDGGSWNFTYSFEMSTEVVVGSDLSHNLLMAGEYMLRFEDSETEPVWLQLPSSATSIAANFTDPNRIAITIANNVYQTQNRGQTWSSLGSQFVPRCTSGKTMGGIGRDMISDDGMYALIRGEDLYHRVGDGSPWTHVDLPIDIDWRTIDFTLSNDTLLAVATHSKGVWIRGGMINDLPETGNPSVSLPNGFVLEPAWPNPFNPSTNITFGLVSPGKVTLKVFDIMGREVATLFEGSAAAGENTLSWNASNISSGVYFVRLTTEMGSDVRKVVRMQ